MKYLFWDCFILADQPILTPLKAQTWLWTPPTTTPPPQKSFRHLFSDRMVHKLHNWTVFFLSGEREKVPVCCWLLRRQHLFSVLHGRVSTSPWPKPASTPSLKSPPSTCRVGDTHSQDSSSNHRAVLGIGPVFLSGPGSPWVPQVLQQALHYYALWYKGLNLYTSVQLFYSNFFLTAVHQQVYRYSSEHCSPY